MQFRYFQFQLRGQDLNLRPRGYEPRELPGCSTPHRYDRALGLVVEACLKFFAGQGNKDKANLL